MEFKKFIKAVGTGPKGNRELTLEESIEMMKQILNRTAPNELIAAFLLGWRLKPETITEYRGALMALDQFVETQTIENSIELGYPFDGKAAHPYLLPLVARELKKFDFQILVMGDDRVPAKEGVTIKDLFTKIPQEENIHYFDRKKYLPSLHALTDIRSLLGVRSAFNTLEKLPKLGNSRFAITGVFHRPYVQKYNDIFQGRYERFALLQGNEGSPELFNKAKFWLTVDNKIQEYLIDPEHYGIEKMIAHDKIDVSATEKLFVDPDKNTLKLVKLNAAILLFVAGKVESIDQGYQLCE